MVFIRVISCKSASNIHTIFLMIGSAQPKENVPPEFYLNKPFLFVIRDNRTGLILFIGKVENPLENG